MLRDRALFAIFWSAADVLVRQGLRFGISTALARLLAVEDFGTIALLYLFMGIATSFVDSGFSAALIQRQDVTHTDESSVFWFNAGMGALVALLLAASAPLIAGMFELPVLIPLTFVMALNVFLSALGAIHATLLTKRLELRVQMQVSAVATLTAGAVAITLALRGFGVWALALQTVTATAMTTAGLWVVCSWRPAFTFSRDSARRLFGFGGYLMASSLLDAAYNRLYTVLLGKLYGVRELGFYNNADSTTQLPVGVLSGVLSKVAFPIFSAAAHDKAMLRRGMRLSLRGVLLIHVPTMLGLAALARPFTLFLFGARWLPAVPPTQVLCLAAALWPLHALNLQLLMAEGYSHLFFRLEMVKKTLGLVFLGIGASRGVMGIAWSQVALSVVGVFINAYYAERHLDYGPLAQLRDVAPVFAVAAAMAAAVYGLSTWLALAPALQLMVLMGSGVVAYLGLGLACRLTALSDAIELGRRLKAALAQPKYSS